MRRMLAPALTALIGLSLITGCANREPAFIADTADPPQASTETPSVEPTPTEETTPDAPQQEAAIGQKVAVVQLQGGYRAEINIDWLAVRDIDPAGIPAECANSISYLYGNKDISLFRIVAVPARVTVNYPNVNGFIWPEASSDGIQLQWSGGFTCNFNTGTYGIYKLPTPAENTGEPTTLVALYAVEKTPDNPNGDFTKGDPASAELEASKVIFPIECPEEVNSYCTFERPAS